VSISRIIAAGVVSLVLGSVLAGCAGSAQSSIKLVDTKPPTQLLRNELTSRIPAGTIDSLGATDDASVACGQDGFKRSWRASQLLFVAPAAAATVTDDLAALVDSLTAEGWTPEESKASSKITESRLTSAKTTSVILLTATEASDDEGNGATLEVAVTGPCVLTDGPESQEVKHLEGRS
jgi:hypothetical protein